MDVETVVSSDTIFGNLAIGDVFATSAISRQMEDAILVKISQTKAMYLYDCEQIKVEKAAEVFKAKNVKVEVVW